MGFNSAFKGLTVQNMIKKKELIPEKEDRIERKKYKIPQVNRKHTPPK